MILTQSSKIRNHAFGVVATASAMPGCMEREKFELKEAKRAGFTLKEFRQFFAVTPCECGKRKCKGWQVRWKWGTQRRREGNA